MLASVRRRLWHEIDLLCRAGVGIAPIAPELAALLRQLIGADAAALFWLDAHGMPEGFHHEDSPDSVKELFLHEFQRLFVGEREINVFALAHRTGQPVGHLLTPGADYFRSNTFNLLVRASGHHHSLDLRVDVMGRARAVVLLFRTQSHPFSEDDAGLLLKAAPYLKRAIEKSVPPEAWQGRPAGHGHLLLDAAAQRIVLMDGDAVSLLRNAGHQEVGWPASTPLAVPPPFIRRLVAHPGETVHLPVPGGVLVARALPLRPPDAGADVSPQMLVQLGFQQPQRMEVVRRVLSLRLSPLQREIALTAGMGHSRTESMVLTGVSPESMKKHLRAIFAATGAHDWDSLSRTLGS